MDEKAGPRFIHKQVDSDLQLSDPVVYEQQRRETAGLETSQKPGDRLADWFEVLEHTHLASGASPERQAQHGQVLERIKQQYHEQYVIKPDDIPDSVFALEVRIARERGDGDIPPYEDFKQQKTKEIIAAQQSSLDRWVNYLTSPDADAAGYPMWARYWAFTAVTKMGKISKEQHDDGTVELKFSSRDEHTVAPFPVLNSKALAQTFAALQYQLEQHGLPKAERRVDNTSTILRDEAYVKMLSNGSFARIYSQFLAENPSTSIERLKETRGKWVKYEHGSDATQLFESLQEHTLEWCTAGDIGTAQSQLDGGDFYVYYSLDDTEQATIPRIAIRMENGQIAEIRGIEHDQHLDPYIGGVLEDKLKDQYSFPNAERHLQGAEDMKLVTAIEHKMGARYNDIAAEFLGFDNPNAELTAEELRFIYELDRKIISLGYGRDPRINQITFGNRDIKSDLGLVFGVSPAKISLTSEEAVSGDVVYHYGDLSLLGFTTVKGLTLPQSIGCDLFLGYFTSVEGLTLPQSIGGDLYLSGLTSAKGLNLPPSIRGGLYLQNLTSVEGLTLPQSIGGDLSLGRLTTVKGLTLPQSIGGDLYLGGLTSAEGLNLPQSIGGDLSLGHLTRADKQKLREKRPDLADKIK